MNEQPNNTSCAGVSRRDFFTRASAIVIGGIAAAVPVVAGALVYFDPVRQKSKSGGNLIRVASLSALPDDGRPYKFSVIASRTDAWNKFPAVPIGAVYLRRTADKQIEALNVICPHAGCFVDYLASQKCFLCPCHNSTFTLEGKIRDAKSPSPRPLDTLPVEVRGDEIYVKFENFRSGIAEKIPA